MIRSISADSIPRTVGATATLQFVTLLNTNTFYITGDTLEYVVPSPGSFTSSNSVSSCVSQTSGVTVTSCTVTTNKVTLTISNTTLSQSLIINVLNFKNPPSTSQITGFSVTLTNGGTTKYQTLNGVIQNFRPDTLNAAQITPNSLLIGDAHSSLTISFTPKNVLSRLGRVYVDLPAWTTFSIPEYHMITTSNPTCTGVTNMKTTIPCEYDSGRKRLTLTGMIDSDISGGATNLVFTVDNFQNPLSSVPKSGFLISTADSNGNQVDQSSSLSVTVTEWADFLQATFDRAQTTVNEVSKGIVNIYLNLPVEANCVLRIDFPTDMPLTDDLQNYFGSNMFSGYSQRTFNKAANYIEINGCPNPTDSIAQGYLELINILNPNQVKQTQSFSYSLYAVSNNQLYRIARKTANIVIQSSDITPGGITSLKVEAVESKVIQTNTRYKLTILPEHSIPTNSKIIVKFPSSISLTDQASCTLSSVSGGMSTSPGSCTVSGNVITITNPFGTGSYTKNGSALSFIFSVGGTNPLSVRDAGQFEVTTQSLVDPTYYTIDTSTFTGVYTPDPFILDASITDISSKQTYFTPSTYTIDITPHKIIPVGGLINVKFPQQISLQNSNLNGCQLKIESTVTTPNQCVVTSTSPPTIQIRDAFTTTAYTSTGTAFEVILGGLINPRTMATTDSFVISTSDSSSYAIESLGVGITVNMTSTPDISQFTVTPSVFTTGATASYLIQVRALLPIITTDSLIFKFPDEITLPASLSCTGQTLITTVTCTLIAPNTIQATLTANANKIDVGVTFSFNVLNVRNPASTKPTSSFTGIIMKDSTNIQITQYNGNAVIVSMTTPATVQTKSLLQDSLALATDTQYTISYTNINDMANNAAFLITYPTTVQITTITACSVEYQGMNYTMSCQLNSNNRQIRITNGLSTAIPRTSSLKIHLSNIKNPSSQQASETFSLISYTDSNFQYSYDKIPDGLIPQFECNYPCATCPPNEKSKCLSCITNVVGEIYTYLSGNTCLERCPDGTYSDQYMVCQNCPTECKTCSDAQTCTSCDTNTIYAYLLEGWCYTTCPNGMCSIRFTCEFCNLDQFTSVTVTPTVKTVSATSNIVEFKSVLPNVLTFTDGAIISYFVPSPASFTPSALTSLCTSTTSGITVTSCIIMGNQVSVKIQATNQNLQSLTVRIGNFNNPPSTCTVNGIKASLVNKDGDSVAQYDTAFMLGLTPALITTTLLSSSSQVVGTFGNILTTTFTVATQLPSTGYIQLRVPFWNPSSSSPQHLIQSPQPSCVGSSPLRNSVSCTYSLDSNRVLTANNLMDVASVASGVSVSFTATDLINPYSTAPKSGFQITTFDHNGCSIDQSNIISLTISDWAQLSQPYIQRADSITEILQYSSFTAGFNLPFPVDSNCRLRIIFPNDMKLDSSLNTFSGDGLFSGINSYSSRHIAQNYVELDGCSTYFDGGQSALVNMAQVLNKNTVSDTLSFTYELYSIVGIQYYQIARTATGLSVPFSSFSPGNILTLAVEAITSSVVQDQTTFKITFTPENSIPTDSEIHILFSPSISLVEQSQCTLSSVSGGISQSGFTSCVVSSNLLKITNPFGTGSYTKNGSALSFIFSVGGTNPSAVKDAGEFQVSTFSVSGTNTYAIDDQKFTGIYTPSPSPLIAQVLTVSSFVTGISPATYTLQLTPNKTIPVNGIISITFPTEIQFPAGRTSFTSCKVNIGGERQVTCTITATSPKIILQITNAFQTAYTSLMTPFTIIFEGLQNPRTTATTSSFSITTANSDGSPIEAISTLVTTAMTSNPNIVTFKVTPQSLTNGQVTDYQILVKSSIAMQTGDIIQFTFPPAPYFTVNSATCAGQTLTTTVACTASSNTVKASITFSQSPIAANTEFTFLVKSITNPPSTKPTTAITNIVGLDSSNNQIQQFLNGPIITMTTPATIQTRSLTQANTNVGVQTTYTITFTNLNLLPSGSSFLLTYPSAILPQIPLTTCTIQAGSNTFIMSTCTITTSTRQIKIADGFSANIPAGTSVKIILGMITNPADQSNTNSLTMISYTDSSQIYSIDQIADGLIPSFACTLPCKTCTTSSKTQCTSCFTTGTSQYLSGNTCVNSCPSGTYADSNKICQTCPSKCKTCSNANTCTTCNTAGKLPNLYNGDCVATCPDGYFNSSNTCLQCNTTACKTCKNTATTCTSCNPSKPYLTSNNQCQSSCDPGYVSINFVCQKCTAPCATCLVSQTTCTSCLSGQLYGTTCIASCPSGYTLVNGRCVGCDPNCQLCSPLNTAQCAICKSGYYQINATCFSSCPDNWQPDPTNTTCVPEYNGDGTIQIGVKETNIYKRTFVYFPFLITMLILLAVSIGGHYKDKSSIIPSNCVAMWGPLYFLALATQILLSYLWITNIEYEIDTPVSTTSTTKSLELPTGNNLHGRFLGNPELLKYWEGDVLPLLFYGTVFALILFVLLNIAFFIAFLVFIRRDPGYIEHRSKYCCIPTMIATVGSLFAFQFGNFYYSRFFGLENFYVPLQDKVKLHTILNIFSIINIVLTLLPIIFIDLYGLLKYSWGSQFYIIIIETLVLSLFLLGFTIWDFKAQKMALKPFEADQLVYAAVADYSVEDPEEKRLNEERKRYNGMTMEEYLNHMLGQKELEKAAFDSKRGLLRKGASMIDLGDRSKEPDERRVNTDPLDDNQKKRYEKWENPFEIDKYPDNCYAVPSDQPKTPLDPSKVKTKVIQYGYEAEDGEDYDKDYERKIRELFHGRNPADERNDSRYLSKFGNDDLLDNDLQFSSRKKNRLRGRKGKYYEQVDDEDQTFLHDRINLNDIDDDEEDDGSNNNDKDQNLHMIEEEESHHDLDDKLDDLVDDQVDIVDKTERKLEEELLENFDFVPLDEDKDEDKVNQLQDTQLFDNTQDKLIQEELQETQLFDVEEAKADMAMLEPQQKSIQLQDSQKLLKQDSQLEIKQDLDDNDLKDQDQLLDEISNNLDQNINDNQQDYQEIDGTNPLFKSTIQIHDDIINDPLLMSARSKDDNDQLQQQQQDQTLQQQPQSDSPIKKDNQHALEEEIIQHQHEEELGEPDSDDDDDQRIANMRDPNKRKFNVNDILGEFDRDEKGNLVILQENKSGNLIDKDGNRVNEKGYRIDAKTGDVVEKEKGKKVFDAKELDERGELPPPYNLERFNFNIHDVRGYFDRDEHGNEIIGNRRDAQGNLVDKLGKRVNEHGYLVDQEGNLVDKRGRVKLHKQIMEQNSGDIPLLFNYKGKKFDITDVMGNLDKDRNGNIIIRRDKDNQMVDKKGRRVNNKGYLIDENGNVINKDGKIMFEQFTLSKDNEIPKFFPFLKFNIDDIKGDYEMDPLGNPMLHKTRDGELVDLKGRKVNSRGYLLDENGNIRNKRGYKVFNQNLLEEGDIPKVFRTGLLRKDTYDSFSQLMSEIEDLERMQEMDIDDPRRQQQMRNKMDKENARLQKRIDQIVEEDMDDDDLLMKEVEKLAQGGQSDAGNTSVDSQMEDTPSNYNVLNQRFNEIDDIKNQAKKNVRQMRGVPEEFEYETEYSYLPGKKLKKKKKKKKKPKKEQEIDLRELKMAVAYGGLTQAQYDKIVAAKKMRDAQNMAQQMNQTVTSQLGTKPPILRNASNTRMTTVQSKRGLPQTALNQQHLRQHSMIQADDIHSEFGAAESVNLNTQQIKPQIGFQTQLRMGTSTTRANNNLMNKTTSRLGGPEQKFIPPQHMQLKKNNLMSDRGDNKSEMSDQPNNNRERRLSQIANSVSGFYINKEGSEHSLMRSTHESNFAQNLGRINRRGQQHNSNEETKGQHAMKPPNTAGFGGLSGMNNDPELERIYGTARGLADMTQLSDWEKDSQRSGKSTRSQFSQVNAFKVRGLENIYLQRLEPANKGRKTALKGQDKAKFRVMHHKFHDEPEWHVDDQRDELDSVLSDNYKQMEMKFIKEFQGNSSGGKKVSKEKTDKNGINIFNGKLTQYKDKQKSQQNTIDFNKY